MAHPMNSNSYTRVTDAVGNRDNKQLAYEYEFLTATQTSLKSMLANEKQSSRDNLFFHSVFRTSLVVRHRRLGSAGTRTATDLWSCPVISHQWNQWLDNIGHQRPVICLWLNTHCGYGCNLNNILHGVLTLQCRVHYMHHFLPISQPRQSLRHQSTSERTRNKYWS